MVAFTRRNSRYYRSPRKSSAGVSEGSALTTAALAVEAAGMSSADMQANKKLYTNRFDYTEWFTSTDRAASSKHGTTPHTGPPTVTSLAGF